MALEEFCWGELGVVDVGAFAEIGRGVEVIGVGLPKCLERTRAFRGSFECPILGPLFVCVLSQVVETPKNFMFRGEGLVGDPLVRPEDGRAPFALVGNRGGFREDRP